MTQHMFPQLEAGIQQAIAQLEEQLRYADERRRHLKAELKKYRKMLAVHNGNSRRSRKQAES